MRKVGARLGTRLTHCASSPFRPCLLPPGCHAVGWSSPCSFNLFGARLSARQVNACEGLWGFSRGWTHLHTFVTQAKWMKNCSASSRSAASRRRSFSRTGIPCRWVWVMRAGLRLAHFDPGPVSFHLFGWWICRLSHVCVCNGRVLVLVTATAAYPLPCLSRATPCAVVRRKQRVFCLSVPLSCQSLAVRLSKCLTALPSSAALPCSLLPCLTVCLPPPSTRICARCLLRT